MIPLLMLSLRIELVISTILLIISIISFVIMYKKAVKNQVDKRDLDDLRVYVDRQDRITDEKVNRMETHMREDIRDIKQGQETILNHIMRLHK